MSVEVKIEVLGNIIATRMTGQWPSLDRELLAHALEHWSRITQMCLERGIRRVINISDIVGGASSTAALRVFSNPEDFGWDRSIRMAIVRPDARTRQIIGMAIEVSKRNGWPFELFATEAEGLAWLASAAPAEGPSRRHG